MAHTPPLLYSLCQYDCMIVLGDLLGTILEDEEMAKDMTAPPLNTRLLTEIQGENVLLGAAVS